ERPVLGAIRESIYRPEVGHQRARRRRGRNTTIATVSPSASGPDGLAPVSQQPLLGGGVIVGASLATGQLYDADAVHPSCMQTVHHIAAQVSCWIVPAAQLTASVRSW